MNCLQCKQDIATAAAARGVNIPAHKLRERKFCSRECAGKYRMNRPRNYAQIEAGNLAKIGQWPGRKQPIAPRRPKPCPICGTDIAAAG